jgi:hypothetical protein
MRSGKTGRIEKKSGLVLLRRAKQGVAEWYVHNQRSRRNQHPGQPTDGATVGPEHSPGTVLLGAPAGFDTEWQDRHKSTGQEPPRRRYWRGSLAAGGSAGRSGSSPPWSSRNGGYRSVINATYTTSR